MRLRCWRAWPMECARPSQRVWSRCVAGTRGGRRAVRPTEHDRNQRCHRQRRRDADCSCFGADTESQDGDGYEEAECALHDEGRGQRDEAESPLEGAPLHCKRHLDGRPRASNTMIADPSVFSRSARNGAANTSARAMAAPTRRPNQRVVAVAPVDAGRCEHTGVRATIRRRARPLPARAAR